MSGRLLPGLPAVNVPGTIFEFPADVIENQIRETTDGDFDVVTDVVDIEMRAFSPGR